MRGNGGPSTNANGLTGRMPVATNDTADGNGGRQSETRREGSERV